jgi:hypothetical protein
MAISIDLNTYVISIPKTDLTLVSGTLYSLDTDAFRLELKSWEDSEVGITQPDTHKHNTEVTIAGITYARTVEILAPYSVEFEDGQYSVRLDGSNNNIWDIQNGILVQNQVQVIPTNSAGLQIVTQGSGVTEQDKLDIADQVWDEMLAQHTDTGSAGEALGNISAGASPSQIADAVLDELISEHTDAGSLSAVIDEIVKKAKAIFNEVA